MTSDSGNVVELQRSHRALSRLKRYFGSDLADQVVDSAGTRLRSMCEELDDVYQALEVWSASELPEAAERRGEYEQIRRELENEVRAELIRINKES